MTKKVLILGGSHSEIPLIKSCQKLGYFVITTGNNIDGLGHKTADKYIPCDYSDKEKILEIAKTVEIEGIISGCNDFALLSSSFAAQKLQLKGHDDFETSLNLHIKDKCRKLTKKLNIKTPKFIKFNKNEDINNILKKFSFPVIVKPVDLSGGKGIKKCENKQDLEKAINLAFERTKENYILVEEFISGTNHGFSAFIKNKKVVFYFVDNEQYYLNKYLVSGASTTTDISQEIINNLIRDCEKIADNLNLVDGLLHTQVIIDENNEPVIIEITRRTPGDLYIKLVEFATDINYSELIVRAELNLPLPKIHFVKPKYNLVRHCVMGNKEGILKEVKIAEKIKDKIKHSLFWYKKGDVIKDKLTYKAGIVFIYFDKETEMNCTIKELNDLITIEVEEG